MEKVYVKKDIIKSKRREKEISIEAIIAFFREFGHEISRSTYERIENTNYEKPIRLDYINTIASILDCPPNIFIPDVVQEPIQKIYLNEIKTGKELLRKLNGCEGYEITVSDEPDNDLTRQTIIKLLKAFLPFKDNQPLQVPPGGVVLKEIDETGKPYKGGGGFISIDYRPDEEDQLLNFELEFNLRKQIDLLNSAGLKIFAAYFFRFEAFNYKVDERKEGDGDVHTDWFGPASEDYLKKHRAFKRQQLLNEGWAAEGWDLLDTLSSVAGYGFRQILSIQICSNESNKLEKHVNIDPGNLIGDDKWKLHLGSINYERLRNSEEALNEEAYLKLYKPSMLKQSEMSEKL